jgi:uncharacterized protein (TIGR00297 family)
VSLWLAALGAAALTVAGYAIGWLTAAGATAAALVGTGVLSGAGLPGLTLLGLFFFSGSALTTWTDRRTRAGAVRRTARQVLANGWTAALGAVMAPVAPSLGWPILAGGLAAAQADTWATEIGATARRCPRLITSGASVPPGTSGGVTTRGTAGGAVGALVFAGAVWALRLPGWLAVSAAAAGPAGMLVDSLLGATVQARYVCPRCGGETEADRHCDGPAVHTRGRRWLTNDVVNLVATGTGACVATLVYILR